MPRPCRIHSRTQRFCVDPACRETAAATPHTDPIVEVYPKVDGEYELRPIGTSPGGISTRLRLYRDIKESRRRQRVIDQPGWEIGLEVAGGYHSGFARTQDPVPGRTSTTG